jgi:hypothetical protein
MYIYSQTPPFTSQSEGTEKKTQGLGICMAAVQYVKANSPPHSSPPSVDFAEDILKMPLKIVKVIY